MSFKRNDDVVKSLIGTPATDTKATPKQEKATDMLAKAAPAIKTKAPAADPKDDELLNSINTVQVPLFDESGRAIFNPHVRPDGEKRTRRLQLTCKESIAKKTVIMTRHAGVSMNYYFEMLINEAWQKWKEANGGDFQKGNK